MDSTTRRILALGLLPLNVLVAAGCSFGAFLLGPQPSAAVQIASGISAQALGDLWLGGVIVAGLASLAVVLLLGLVLPEVGPEWILEWRFQRLFEGLEPSSEAVTRHRLRSRRSLPLCGGL